MLLDSPRRSWRSSQANAFLRLLQKFESDYPGLRHNLTAWQLSQGLWRLSQVEWPADEAHETSGGAAERETLRLAARASTLASASYGPFGALLVGWSRGLGPLLSTSWQLLRGIGRHREVAFETHTRALGLRAGDILHAQWRPVFYERRGQAGLPVRRGRERGRGAIADAAATSDAVAADDAAAVAAEAAGPLAAELGPYAYTPAHLLLVDHQERSVVLVVRGSLELADVLADMQVAPTRRDQRRLGRGCHGGMADAAWRLAGMHEERLRQSLHDHRGYTLTLTGHSLGAGVATYAAVL